MSHPHKTGSVDVVRKTAIVAVLLAGLVLLHRFVGTPTEALDPRGLLALGFVVLAAHAVGELAEVIKLPHITGYLLAGLVLGPSAAHELGQLLPSGVLPAPFDHGVLNEAVIGQLAVLDILALPLICLTAGGELNVTEIRKGLKQILGLLGGQVVVLMIAFMAFAWAISGAIPSIALPALDGVTGGGLVAVGGVLASLALATSAAATIAIIVGTGSRGQMTNTVLSVVVMKDVTVVVMFAAFTALAGSMLGTGEATSFSTSLVHIGQSVGLGALVGGLIHLYLRYVKAELLLFLVGLIFTVSWVSNIIHAEVALLFITAGFVVNNFSDLGEPLIEEVERLSLPVYVVFFTLAGARLHLDVIAEMAGFALALVLLRTAAVWLGTRAGAVASGADENTRRYGWMGMISQAGLSISLASQLPDLLPGALGEGLFSLVLAGVAVHEVVGPALLQVGLSMAGETAEKREVQETQDAQAQEGPSQDSAPGDSDAASTTTERDPWAPAFRSLSPRLESLVAELQQDLVVAVDAWYDGIVEPVGRDHEEWIGSLRREFLRAHRRTVALVRSGTADIDQICDAFDDFAQAWREQVLSRAARPACSNWETLSLLSTLDARVDALPVLVDAPVEAESFLPRKEWLWLRLARLGLRQRARLTALNRQVGFRDLARYHLSGGAVGRLEGLAALGIRAELQPIDDAAAAFDIVALGFTALARQASAGTLDRQDAEAALWEMRNRTEEKLQLALQGVTTAGANARVRAAAVLGAGLAHLKRELAIAGTLDLPYWRRRMGRVYAERNRGVAAATEGLTESRRTVSLRYFALALDMEVASLEVAVAEALERQGASLERIGHDLGLRQLSRAHAEVAQALAAFGAVLDEPGAANAMASQLRQDGERTLSVLAEARKLLLRLNEQLAGESGVAPLRDALLGVCRELTERYTVPSTPVHVGSWSLGVPVQTTVIRLREMALAFIETRVAQTLQAQVGEHRERFAVAAALVDELDRVLSFNLDLAAAELEVHQDAPPPAEAIALTKGMLLASVGRIHDQLETELSGLDNAPAELRSGVDALVREAFTRLRNLATSGEVGELRRLLRVERSRRQALRGVGVIGRSLPRAAKRVAAALGPVRAQEWREWLGLRRSGTTPVSAKTFAAPRPSVDLPPVYRRLFGSHGLGVGEELVGRAKEISRAHAALVDPRRQRVVAVVGGAGSGITAITNAIWSLHTGPKPQIIRLDAPVSVDDVEAWFDGSNTPVALSGLQWMFRLGSGGAAPLQRFVECLLETSGSRTWVLDAEIEVWRTACLLAPLRDATAEVVQARSLSADELEQAILVRHRMSGYTLDFGSGGALGTVPTTLFGLRMSATERRQRTWFRQLHAASGGLMVDAMRLWMASVVEVDVDAGRMRIGAPPSQPFRALALLGPQDLLVLRHALRQGWITPELHSDAFGCTLVESRAALAGLRARGLLETAGEVTKVARHLHNGIVRVLDQRGWNAWGL